MIACIKDVVTWFGTIKAGSLCEFDPVTQENLLDDYPDSLIETQADIRYLLDSVHRHYKGWCNYIDDYHWTAPEGFAQDHYKYEIIWLISPSAVLRIATDYSFSDDTITFIKPVPAQNQVFITWQECALDRDENMWVKSL